MNKKSFFGGSSDLFLFRENTLMAVSAVVSLLLQIISFFTTLDGAKAYFAATFAYAPLLFALAVQSVVYFLENGLRRRATFLKVLALTMALGSTSVCPTRRLNSSAPSLRTRTECGQHGGVKWRRRPV